MAVVCHWPFNMSRHVERPLYMAAAYRKTFWQAFTAPKARFLVRSPGQTVRQANRRFQTAIRRTRRTVWPTKATGPGKFATDGNCSNDQATWFPNRNVGLSRPNRRACRGGTGPRGRRPKVDDTARPEGPRGPEDRDLCNWNSPTVRADEPKARPSEIAYSDFAARGPLKLAGKSLPKRIFFAFCQKRNHRFPAKSSAAEGGALEDATVDPKSSSQFFLPKNRLNFAFWRNLTGIKSDDFIHHQTCLPRLNSKNLDGVSSSCKFIRQVYTV